MTVGQDVVKKAEKDPEYLAKVITKLEASAKDLKARLVKTERALKAFKKLR
jgi:hypothetical protein